MPSKPFKPEKPGIILNKLLEMEASPVDRARRIRELERSCTQGYTTEVNTARGDIVEVRVTEPKTALACNQALGAIFERYEDMVLLDHQDDRSVNIFITDLTSGE
jgi:hypothetical protein